MAITLEQVEKLREKAAVTYEEAKAALEQTDGDLLEALILLERQGRVNSGGRDNATFFTTRPGGDEGPVVTSLTAATVPPRGGKSKKDRVQHGDHPGFWDQVKQFLQQLWNIIRHSLTNQFEVWRGEEMTTSMPVLILIILVCVAPWITVPVLIVGLFFGLRYRFSGPDLNKEKVNDVMETVTATVNEVVDTVKSEFHKATHKKEE